MSEMRRSAQCRRDSPMLCICVVARVHTTHQRVGAEFTAQRVRTKV